jgi:hypothetical protein
MAKKPAPPLEAAPEPADELPPEVIRERMKHALTRAFTLPHKPHQKDEPKRPKP